MALIEGATENALVQTPIGNLSSRVGLMGHCCG